jgi:DNA-binding SARP family transcriptional activator
LIDELWGESPPPTARKAVNVHVSQLRKALTRNGRDPIATGVAKPISVRDFPEQVRSYLRG